MVRQRLYDIIFEAETPAGKGFDILLFACIFASVAVVMLDSIGALNVQYGQMFLLLEWGFTLIFTIEYGLRLWVVARPSQYALSFFGIIDLCAVLPTYLSLIVPGGRYLLVIRLLRLLRIFRVLKMVQFVTESKILMRVFKESLRKIFIFIFAVLILVVILGSIMYSIEGGKNGFTSIPKSIYWAIVTLTTVGYGDIAPGSILGQVFAAIIMLLGYGMIAVPAGIVTSELTSLTRHQVSTEVCPFCTKEGHDPDARFCKFCGGTLNPA